MGKIQKLMLDHLEVTLKIEAAKEELEKLEEQRKSIKLEIQYQPKKKAWKEFKAVYSRAVGSVLIEPIPLRLAV